MSRTKAEVRAFLDDMVDTIPLHPAPYNTGKNNLSGQCVTEIKAILEFLGVPNPYAARGNAKDVGDTLLRQGIAQEGRGWLTIVINRDMGLIDGIRYGHIWADLLNEANYETNGAKALTTTKNTRPISQGQQFVNLDNYIKENGMSYNKSPIDPKLVVEHFSNYTNGHTIVKATDPAAVGRFEITGDDADANFWRGLNTHQLDIIRGQDAQIVELNRKLANAGAGVDLEPAAQVDGKTTLWRAKA